MLQRYRWTPFHLQVEKVLVMVSHYTQYTHTRHAHTVHTVLPGPVDPFSSIGGFSDDPFKTPTATTFGGSGGFSDPFAVS